MARRYDAGTTTFSPEGRLYQVEYSIAAIGNSTASVAVLCRDGVAIAAERKVASKLLAPPRSSEKMFALDEHVLVAVAGLTADANILLTQGRVAAQRHRYAHGGAPMAVEPLVAMLADYKHSYTQYGGLRPFGCAFIYAGWDAARGFQLYQSDPSGNYSGWKATAIGNNAPAAVAALKTEYTPGLSLEEGKLLAIKVLCKALDTAHPTSERLEGAVLHFVGGETSVAAQTPVSVSSDAQAPPPPPRGARLAQDFLTDAEVDALIALAVPPAPAAVAPGAAQASI